MNVLKVSAFLCFLTLSLGVSRCSSAQNWVLENNTIISYHTDLGTLVNASGHNGNVSATRSTLYSAYADATFAGLVHWSAGPPPSPPPPYSVNVSCTMDGSASTGDSASSVASATDPAYRMSYGTDQSNPYTFSYTPPTAYTSYYQNNYTFYLYGKVQINTSGHTAIANSAATISMTQ